MHERQSQYQGLRFDSRPSLTRPRLIAVAVGLALFTALWWLVPLRALYWLLLPLVATLIWLASYGWRQGLTAVHDLIHRLEQS